MLSRRLIAVGVAIVLVASVGTVGFALTRPHPGVSGSLGAPHFVEEGAASGIDLTYDGGSTDFVGGGVAVFDCNGDGKPEIYLAGGLGPAALYRNDSAIGGALRFSRLADPVTDQLRVLGAYPLDVDGDGIMDLVLLRMGGATLLRGLGNCRFTEANAALSLDGGRGYTTAFSAAWEADARLPTLAIGRYLALDAAGQPTLDCDTSAVLRPNAAGTGYAPAIPLTPGDCALSMLFSDWDRSGRRDLRVSNDRNYYDPQDGGEQLWRMTPGAPPRLYTAADGWVQVQIEGMGIASDDVTGDGYPDIFLTSQASSRLQTLINGPAQPMYRDIGGKRGVNAAQPFTGGDPRPSTAWHPEFEDVNNDGFIDLFISKGNINTLPDYAMTDPNNLLLGQPDGTFVEGADAAGVLNEKRGRGAALADFNLDGLPDLVEVNLGDPARIWRNVGSGTAEHPAAMGNWLDLQLSEPGPNVNAVGSWIEVQVGDVVMRRELTVGGGHAGGQAGWIHFGLGSASDAEVRIQWPDGTVGPWVRAPANEFATVRRATSDILPWTPGTPLP